jgi:hypothetical protein
MIPRRSPRLATKTSSATTPVAPAIPRMPAIPATAPVVPATPTDIPLADPLLQKKICTLHNTFDMWCILADIAKRDTDSGPHMVITEIVETTPVVPVLPTVSPMAPLRRSRRIAAKYGK